MVSRLKLAAVIAFWSITAAAWAGIELDISPVPVIVTQSFQMTFRVTGETAGQPDFSPLEDSFDIIARNRHSSLKWINGHREQATLWIINVMPHDTGQVEIPPISFGSERSAARVIEVIATTHETPDSDARIVIQVEAAPLSLYVQQQVIYTVRLLHRVELGTPRFSSLTTSSDAIIKQLGKGREYSHRVNGRRYGAVELRYAIYPQKSGPLTIHPIVLTAHVAIGKRTVFDPFSRNVMTKRVESESTALDIKPIPAAFPNGATWLPARHVRLYEDWEPDIKQADVGVPLNRTIFLWADGLLSGQLPDVRFKAPSGIKLYPDQTQATDQNTANGFTSVIQERFAFIASRAGTPRFAAIEVPWWNTETDQMELARLPERQITMAGAAVAEAVAANPGATSSSDSAAAPLFPHSHWAGAAYWFWVALALGLMWFVTLGMWWRRTRRHEETNETGSKPVQMARAIRHLEGACRANAASQARHALMAWSCAMPTRGERAGLRSLRALAEQVSGELAREINVLERHLYGKSVAAWQGLALWEAFNRHRRERAAAHDPTDDPLPPIFKLAVK